MKSVELAVRAAQAEDEGRKQLVLEAEDELVGLRRLHPVVDLVERFLRVRVVRVDVAAPVDAVGAEPVVPLEVDFTGIDLPVAVLVVPVVVEIRRARGDVLVERIRGAAELVDEPRVAGLRESLGGDRVRQADARREVLPDEGVGALGVQGRERNRRPDLRVVPAARDADRQVRRLLVVVPHAEVHRQLVERHRVGDVARVVNLIGLEGGVADERRDVLRRPVGGGVVSDDSRRPGRRRADRRRTGS